MSTNDDKNKEAQNTQDEKVTVIVDRTKIEKELQDKLDTEKLEKKTVNDNLTKAQIELDALKKADQEKTEKYKLIEEEAKKNKDRLTEIAMKEFNRRKDLYIDNMKKSGLQEEKVSEISEKIKTPKDLDDAEVYLTLIPTLINKSAAEREAEAKKKVDEEAAQAAAQAGAQSQTADKKKVGGVVTLDQKEKDGIYGSYREGIDDLYKKAAQGDKKADQQLKDLWKMGVKLLKEGKGSFGISECPRCGGGIKQNESCPYCGFDPATYIQPKSNYA